MGVNNTGQVVGSGDTASGNGHAFLWTKEGGMIDLGTLGGSSSMAFAINGKGQVVGESGIVGDAATHAFLWTKEGGMIDLGTLGGTYCSARYINNNGQIAGESYPVGDADWHAVVWEVIKPPVANAGPAQTVQAGALVQLDGSNSTPASNIVYQWAQISGPVVILSDPTLPRPTFIAPRSATKELL